MKGRFRRGAAEPSKTDERVQHRLREVAAREEPRTRPEPWTVPPPEAPRPPEPAPVARSVAPPTPSASAPTPPWSPPHTLVPAPKPRRRPRGAIVLLVLLGMVMVSIVVTQIDARRSHGWKSEAGAGTQPTSWPAAPSDASSVRLGKPPSNVPKADSYKFMARQSSGEPVTYDPCVPIHYVVNDRRAFDGADEALAEAVAEIEKATGLVMVDDGATDEAPAEERASQDEHYGDYWSPVLIAWSDGYETSVLNGEVAGVAGSQSFGSSSQQWFVTGSAVFDGPQLKRVYRTENGPAKVRAVIMHELGHLVGLAHVSAPGELMRASASGLTSWGPGDRAGLAQLGQGRCH